MYTAEALQDIHERAHRNFKALLGHCAGLENAALVQEQAGFGYPTVLAQLYHAISAERYWVGVLQGLMLVDDDEADYPTVERLETLRAEVFATTEAWLLGKSHKELDSHRAMITWGGHERQLCPAHVILRTVTHLYHHQGQVVAMCRLLGRPATGLDFPLI